MFFLLHWFITKQATEMFPHIEREINMRQQQQAVKQTDITDNTHMHLHEYAAAQTHPSKSINSVAG